MAEPGSSLDMESDSSSKPEGIDSQKDENKETKDVDSERLQLEKDLDRQLGFVERALSSKEIRFVLRILRQLHSIRRRMLIHRLDSFSKLVEQAFSSSLEHPLRKHVLELFDILWPKDSEKMDIDAKPCSLPEMALLEEYGLTGTQLYLSLLVALLAMGQNKPQLTRPLLDAIVSCSIAVGPTVKAPLDPVMDALVARGFFYFSRAYELLGELHVIRGKLLSAHRVASLRHMDETKATILNLLLRNYLEYDLFDQAEHLVSKSPFAEQSASANQFARYLYYQAKIKSIQLDYAGAENCLQQAMRKAPQTTALGFRVAVTKLLCIVQLLLGDIPDRSLFSQKGVVTALSPYLQLTQAVHVGNLIAFENVVQAHIEVFQKDKTNSLIQRLRHNVIKIGLRKINLSYSRISLEDVAAKLHLNSIEDCEFIVAKAIRDGVIDAEINSYEKYVQSKDNVDVYSTQEPQAAFHKRICFCMNIHNEALKAMRFAPDAHKPRPLQSEDEQEHHHDDPDEEDSQMDDY